MKIILHPYAARLRSGKRNAKNYPWWPQVVMRLANLGHEVIQIGSVGEQRIEGVSQFIIGWPFEKLKEVAKMSDTFMAVDSFWPHFCHTYQLGSGVVVWGPSDPNIWGHPENVNLTKDRKYLREFQYQDWESCEYNEAAFVLPQVVVDAVLTHVSNTPRT